MMQNQQVWSKYIEVKPILNMGLLAFFLIYLYWLNKFKQEQEQPDQSGNYC